MFVSANPIVIVLHVLAMLALIVAAFVRVRGERWHRFAVHFGWAGLALYALALVLADFGVFN